LPRPLSRYRFFACQGRSPSAICSGKRSGSAAARKASRARMPTAWWWPWPSRGVPSKREMMTSGRSEGPERRLPERRPCSQKEKAPRRLFQMPERRDLRVSRYGQPSLHHLQFALNLLHPPFVLANRRFLSPFALDTRFLVILATAQLGQKARFLALLLEPLQGFLDRLALVNSYRDHSAITPLSSSGLPGLGRVRSDALWRSSCAPATASPRGPKQDSEASRENCQHGIRALFLRAFPGVPAETGRRFATGGLAVCFGRVHGAFKGGWDTAGILLPASQVLTSAYISVRRLLRADANGGSRGGP